MKTDMNIANDYAVKYGARPTNLDAMRFKFGVSSGRTRYDSEPIRLEAGFNDLYDLFGYLVASHSWHGRPRAVWFEGRMLMPVDLLLNAFEDANKFEDWAKYAIIGWKY